MFKKSNQRTPFWQKREEGSERGSTQMHPATCAECGQSCEVPFKPTGSRPVFCRECFKGNQEDSRPPRSFGGDRSFDEKKMYKTRCATCGEECSVPFQPKPGRAIYCRNCMGKKEGGRDFNAPREDRRGGENKGWSLTKEQFEMLNSKMDKILKLLQVAQPNIVASVKKEEPVLKKVIKPKAKPAQTKSKKAKVTKVVRKKA